MSDSEKMKVLIDGTDRKVGAQTKPHEMSAAMVDALKDILRDEAWRDEVWRDEAKRDTNRRS